MVFNRKQENKPKHGDIKVKVRFALYPIFTDDSIVWLQRYYVTYQLLGVAQRKWVKEDTKYIIDKKKRWFFDDYSDKGYVLALRKGIISSKSI